MTRAGGSNGMIKIGATLLVIVIFLELLLSVVRKRCQGRLVDLLEEGDYEAFDEYCGKWAIKAAIPAYTAKVMKLNAAMQKGDHAQIKETFQEIEGLKLTSQEKADISLRGFYYFLPKRDGEMCKKYAAGVRENSRDEAMKETVSRFYDVLIEKKDGMLDVLLAEMEGQAELERYTNEYLVSEIYRNRGDGQRAGLYSGLSKKHKQAYLKAMSSMEFGKKYRPRQ